MSVYQISLSHGRYNTVRQIAFHVAASLLKFNFSETLYITFCNHRVRYLKFGPDSWSKRDKYIEVIGTQSLKEKYLLVNIVTQLLTLVTAQTEFCGQGYLNIIFSVLIPEFFINNWDIKSLI